MTYDDLCSAIESFSESSINQPIYVFDYQFTDWHPGRGFYTNLKDHCERQGIAHYYISISSGYDLVGFPYIGDDGEMKRALPTFGGIVDTERKSAVVIDCQLLPASACMKHRIGDILSANPTLRNSFIIIRT